MPGKPVHKLESQSVSLHCFIQHFSNWHILMSFSYISSNFGKVFFLYRFLHMEVCVFTWS